MVSNVEDSAEGEKKIDWKDKQYIMIDRSDIAGYQW